MRRAGWEVWLATGLEGNYEECPPTVIDLAERDRRWLQGNLQHTRLIFAKGFHAVNRVHFLLGILSYLNEHPGEVITRKALIHSVWGQHADVRSRSIDQYVVKVRELFKKKGLDLADFQTVHGIGYIFDPKKVTRKGA